MPAPTTAPRMHPWWLTFVDSDLEAEFRRDYFERTLQQVRFSFVAASLMLLSLAAGLWVDIGQFLGRDNPLLPGERLLGVARAYFVLELPLMFALTALSFTRVFRRVAQPVVALTAFVILFAVPVGTLAAGPDYPVWFFPFLLVAALVPMYVGTRLRIGYAAFVFPTVSVCWLAAALITRVPASELAVLTSWLMIVNTLGMMLLWQAERFARSEFLGRRTIAEQRERLRAEQEKAERLLLNVLPEPIAARLKEGEATIADRFEHVSVLFADIVGFTPLSQTLPAERVVRHLGEIFSRFDRIAQRHGLEKIKTIGDAYMVAAGLPEPRADHAHAVARMALELRDAVAAIDIEGRGLSMRIGIASGPAVAGVIGHTKFSYDVWGDTVNTASRMESHGEPGSIQVDTATYDHLRDDFELEPRGEIEVKGKGRMATWWLRGKKA